MIRIAFDNLIVLKLNEVDVDILIPLNVRLLTPMTLISFRFGRRRVYVVMFTLGLASSIATAFASLYVMLLVLRFSSALTVTAMGNALYISSRLLAHG